MSVKSDVVVIGAGAAGLTAAYHLQKAGLSVKVLEAADCIGGRLRKDDTLADFPLDMGGAWIHGNPKSILNPLVDADVASRVETVLHYTGWVRLWIGKRFIKLPPTPRCLQRYHKWVGSTWWDFFNENIVANLEPGTIVFQSPVTNVDSRKSRAEGKFTKVTCANGVSYQASFLVVTVSMELLKQNAITFTPALPKFHLQSISRYRMGHALKLFMKFERKFYPLQFFILKDLVRYSFREASENFSQREFWDETYGQSTSCHILGVFCYGRICERYLSLYQDHGKQGVIDDLLTELDDMFDGKATKYHEGSVAAFWPNEQFVKTGYTHWTDWGIIAQLQRPARNGAIHFAGESIPVDQENWGFAHGAAMSGKDAARKIIELKTSGKFAPTGSWW